MGAGPLRKSSLVAALLLAALAPGGAARAESPREEAKRLTRLSIREYEALEYDRALADAVRAFELSGAPELLYNIGQCHRAIGHWKEAETSYRNFLRERPDSPNRALVLQLISEMQAKQVPAPPAAAPPPAAAAPAAALEQLAPAPPRKHPALSYVLFGASAVTAAFAIAGAVRVVDYDSALSPSSYSGYQQELAARTNASNWGTALLVLAPVAVACVVGGFVAW